MSIVSLIYVNGAPKLTMAGAEDEGISTYAGTAENAKLVATDAAALLSDAMGMALNDPSFKLAAVPYVPNDTPFDPSMTPLLDIELDDPNGQVYFYAYCYPLNSSTLIPWGNARGSDAPTTLQAIADAITGNQDFNVLRCFQDPVISNNGKRLSLALSVTDQEVDFILAIPTNGTVELKTWGNSTITGAPVDNTLSSYSGRLYQKTDRFNVSGDPVFPYQFTVDSDIGGSSLYIPAIRELSPNEYDASSNQSLRYGLGWRAEILNALIDNSATLQSGGGGGVVSSIGTDRTVPAFFRPWSEMRIFNESQIPSGSIDSLVNQSYGRALLNLGNLYCNYLREFKFTNCGYHRHTIQPNEWFSFTALCLVNPNDTIVATDGRALEIGTSRYQPKYIYDVDGAPLAVSTLTSTFQRFSDQKYEYANFTDAPIDIIIPVINHKNIDGTFAYVVTYTRTPIIYDVHDLGQVTDGQVVSIPFANMGTITLDGTLLTGGQRVSYIRFPQEPNIDYVFSSDDVPPDTMVRLFQQPVSTSFPSHQYWWDVEIILPASVPINTPGSTARGQDDFNWALEIISTVDMALTINKNAR